jgi:hypothetical protein
VMLSNRSLAGKESSPIIAETRSKQIRDLTYLGGLQEKVKADSDVARPNVAIVGQRHGSQIPAGGTGVGCPAAYDGHGC